MTVYKFGNSRNYLKWVFKSGWNVLEYLLWEYSHFGPSKAGGFSTLKMGMIAKN